MLPRAALPILTLFCLIATLVVLRLGLQGHWFDGSSAQTSPAFYFWKTRWQPEREVLESLERNRVARLYVRFFDVAWDRTRGTAEPVAPLVVASPFPARLEIIPVTYLKNEVFQQISETGAKDLAHKIFGKIRAMARSQNLSIRELQVDCDWTDSTRARYFQFAEQLRETAHAFGVNVSATIRLHQIKYAARTGVPPVDRGMLMFYNMGQLTADASRSSIYNAQDAKRYLAELRHYPLKLDLVLPAFSWLVHLRDGRIVGLIEDVSPEEFLATDGFRRDSARALTATDSRFFRGRFFKEGDRLLVDQIDPSKTLEAAQLVASSTGPRQTFSTIAIFDLNGKVAKDYGEAELASILHFFN